MKIQAEVLTSDPLNYIYVSKRNEIFKFNEEGDTLFRQSLKLNGEITTIDALQALRILVYYKDQQLIGFLDNTLSWHNEPRNLNRAGILSSTAACHSFLENSIWVFDQDNFSLKRLDRNLKLITEINNLSAIFNSSFYVLRMKEIQNKLYVQVEDEGLFVFDVFGTFDRRIPLESNLKFKVIHEYVYYIDQGKLFRYNSIDFEVEAIELPVENINNFTITEHRLVIADEKRVYFYEIL